jgi:L-lactate utilization protein LutB
MVTEETGLVPALEAAGVETIETDLGEFIIQLDHDAPSHIVAPMIHKDRTAVGRAFARELACRIHRRSCPPHGDRARASPGQVPPGRPRDQRRELSSSRTPARW